MEIILCKCGKEAIHQFKNGSWCCNIEHRKCSENRKKYSQPGSKNPMFGKKQSEKAKEKMRKPHKASSEDFKKKQKARWTIEEREKVSKRMKSWQSLYMSKRIKNPSNEEIKLRNIIKEIYPQSEHTYPVLNYQLDIALPEYKIGIEYDGWYHFHTEEAKEYFRIRKEKLEKEGWKLISYTIFNKFPLKEQINKDILEMIKNET